MIIECRLISNRRTDYFPVEHLRKNGPIIFTLNLNPKWKVLFEDHYNEGNTRLGIDGSNIRMRVETMEGERLYGGEILKVDNYELYVTEILSQPEQI